MPEERKKKTILVTWYYVDGTSACSDFNAPMIVPPEVREELEAQKDHIINKLQGKTYVCPYGIMPNPPDFPTYIVEIESWDDLLSGAPFHFLEIGPVLPGEKADYMVAIAVYRRRKM